MERIYFAIVNRGKANSLLKFVKKFNIHEGSILLGEGTIRSKVLESVGLNQTQKEVVMIPVSIQQDALLHKEVSEKFEFNEKNKGIGFSVPFMRWSKDSESFGLEDNHFDYHLIMAIVDKGKTQNIIRAARKAKARGGTIIHGRGAGVPKDYYFHIDAQPQKDTVLIVVSDKKVEQVTQAIQKVMTEEKLGILFALPVVSTSGIFEERIEEKKERIEEKIGKIKGERA